MKDLSCPRPGVKKQLRVYSDAGFAGLDTHAQNGLVILWGGTVITWRSSRAALSAISTAEAELCAAALGWQVTEGIRYLLATLRVYPPQIDFSSTIARRSQGRPLAQHGEQDIMLFVRVVFMKNHNVAWYHSSIVRPMR